MGISQALASMATERNRWKRERGREGERERERTSLGFSPLGLQSSSHRPSDWEQWRASRASEKHNMALHSAGGSVFHTPRQRCVLPLMLAHLTNAKGASTHYKGALRRTTAAAWRAYHIISYHIISYHIISYHITSYTMYAVCCMYCTVCNSLRPLSDAH